MAQDLFGGSGAINANWTVVAGSFTEGGGNAYGASSAASSLAVYNAETPGDDHEAYIILQPRGGGDYHGPAVRCATGAFTCANVDAGADGLYVSTWSAGSQTVVAGPLTCPAAGTKITLRAVGTQLRLYFDDVEQTGSGSPWSPGGLPSTGTWGMTAYNNNQGTGASEWGGTNLSATAEADQEGFRFGLDDGSESAHTWAQAQDTNDSVEVGTARLIRALINATGDPASAAFTLRYQKNGAGGYIAVPVGAGNAETYSQPTWGAAGTAASGTTSCAPSYPTGISASTSKLLCLVTGRSNTADTVPTMPAGWTRIGGLEGGTGTWGVDTGTRRVDFFIKDTVTGSETGTVTVSLSGTTANTLRATIFRIEVPAGYSLDTELVSGADTSNDTAYSATASSSVTFDPNRLVLVGVAQNIDTGTLSAVSLTAPGITFGTLTSRASTAVTNGNDHRHILYSAPVSSGTGTVAPTFAYTISASGSGPAGFLVLRARLPAVTNEIYVAASANIAAGGEATTARLTPPSGKTTSDFVTGRRWDDENGADAIDITVDDYTEVEWSINTQAPAANGDYFDFRVYAGASALTSYTVTPRLTLGAPAPTISGTSSATPAEGSTLTISGSNFQAAQGAGGVVIGGVAQVETAWSDTSVSVTVSKGTSIKNGVAVNVVLTDNDGGASNAFALTSILPPSGWQYVNIGTPNTTASNRLTASPDIASGDQVEWGNIVGTGSVTVFDDGTFVADGGVAAFDFRVFTTGDGWGSVATQTISAATQIAGAVAVASASGLQASVALRTVIAGGIGAASASGLAATVRPSTVVAGQVGTAVASGLAATVRPSTVVAGQVGTAVASGLAATVRPSTVVAGQVGTAVASGAQASISAGLSIAVQVGTATASGLNAAINVGNGFVIAAGVGAATASGQQATVVNATVIAAGAAAAQAAGLGAQIVIATRISAAAGTASADGLPASISSSSATVIQANTGQADASGLPAGLSVGTVISGGVASATAEGLVAGITVQLGAQISAGVGEASASGASASLALVELVDPSTFWRYDVPGLSLRHDIPAASLRFDVPSIGSGIAIN